MTPVRKAGETEVQHLANIVRDNSTVLQALQMDMHHVSKALDKLVTVAEKQATMAGDMKSQGDSIDRAFRTMDKYKDDLAVSIRELAEAFRQDGKDRKTIEETVIGYRASLKTLYLVAGVAGVLLASLASVIYTTLQANIERNTNLILVLEAKNERERVTDNLIAAEHNQRLVRLESKGDEVAP